MRLRQGFGGIPHTALHFRRISHGQRTRYRNQVLEGAQGRPHHHAQPDGRSDAAAPPHDGSDRRRWTRADLAVHLDPQRHRRNPHPRRQSAFSLVSKGHDLFAAVEGIVSVDNDPVVIDRLWNPFVAAWYEGGKSDPELVLLRFDSEKAEIWLGGSSLLAGIKMLFGGDPKRDFSDKVAKVTL